MSITRFQVNADDARIRQTVQSWLDGLRLELPAPITLDITRGFVPSPIEAGRTIFEQPAVTISHGPPSYDLRVAWRLAPACATLPKDSTQIHIAISDSGAQRLDDFLNTFLITVIILSLRRVGWHHVHAASAEDPSGRGWLIAGDARAGKSTTAALMASRGWRVGSDDTTFLARDNGAFCAWSTRQPLALRRGGHTLLGDNQFKRNTRRNKFVCWPEQLGGSWTNRIVPDIILFSKPGARVTTCEPIKPIEALAELVRWSAWVMLEPDLAQNHLDLLNTIAQRTTSYRAQLGSDLFQDPTRLSAILP